MFLSNAMAPDFSYFLTDLLPMLSLKSLSSVLKAAGSINITS